MKYDETFHWIFAPFTRNALHAMLKTLHCLLKTLYVLLEKLNGLHETLSGSHKTLNGLHKKIIARNSHFFIVVVVRLRVCKFI